MLGFKTPGFFYLDNDIIQYRSHDFEIAELRWMTKTDDIVLKPNTIKTEFTQNGFDFEGVSFI